MQPFGLLQANGVVLPVDHLPFGGQLGGQLGGGSEIESVEWVNASPEVVAALLK